MVEKDIYLCYPINIQIENTNKLVRSGIFET
ncbi:hypothetical protein BN1318_390010 [Staphylococcus capitis]|nr:hypothetical protein BN1318_390010 [Staphylococcus capitis]